MPNKGDVLAGGGKSAQFQQPTKEMAGTEVWKDMPALEPVFMPEPAVEFLAPKPEETPREKPQVGYEGDPTGDCVLVQRVEREHSSNLIVPDSMKAKSDIGFIKAVGKAVKFYKPGNLVLFDRFASHGADISLLDEDGVERHMLLLREYDILMRLKKINL